MKFSIIDKNLIEHYRKSPAFTIADLLIVALIVFAITVSITYAFPTIEATNAIIYVDGKEFGRYSLNNDREIMLLEGKVIVSIKEGAIAVTESDCPTHICLKSGYIDKAGERIVCAPNKVIVVLHSSIENVHVTGGGL